MRKVWYIAGKELLQTRRDRLAALFTIALPVVFTVFLGFMISGFDDGTDTFPLAVADADGSTASQQLVERLGEIPLLELQNSSPEAVETAVQEQEVPAGIIIPEGFGEALTAGRPAAVEFIRMQTSTGAQSVLETVQAVVAESNALRVASAVAADQVAKAAGRPADDALREQATALVQAQLDSPMVSVQTQVSGGSRARQLGGFDQASIGSLVNWVLFSLLTIAVGLVWERRTGLLKRLNVSGVSAVEIFGGKLLAMLVITFLQQLFLVLLGQLAFGVDYFNDPAALLLVMVSLSVFASSVGLLITSVFRSEGPVVATIVIAAQLLAVLGGAWFPLEITSATFSRVAHFLPTAWIVDSLHGIVLRDWGVIDVLLPLGIVWLWIVLFFGLAVWRFRPE